MENQNNHTSKTSNKPTRHTKKKSLI